VGRAKRNPPFQQHSKLVGFASLYPPYKYDLGEFMLKNIKEKFKWLIFCIAVLGVIVTIDDIIEICCEHVVDCDEHMIEYTKDLFSNPNKANLQVEILPNPSFKEGENMQMRFLSEKEGKLLVFDINSDGALTLLMPNQHYNEGFKLKANKTFMIPEKTWGFDLPAQEPLGNGMLVSILIEDEIDLKSILPVSVEVLNAEMAKPILQHLHDQLNKPVMLDGVLRPRKWSGVFSDYEINNK
jgi:hypothetical protein